MKRSSTQPLRILAIDPFVSGLGFVVIEGSEGLIDWGLRTVKGKKYAACLRIVETFIERYSLNLIVVENCQAKGCRLGKRAKEMIEDIVALAKARRIKCRRVARLSVQKAFSQHEDFNKHQIATRLAERFPELACHLPRPRKPWMSEDARMSIFDALALAITCYGKERFQSPLQHQSGLNDSVKTVDTSVDTNVDTSVGAVSTLQEQ